MKNFLVIRINCCVINIMLIDVFTFKIYTLLRFSKDLNAYSYKYKLYVSM